MNQLVVVLLKLIRYYIKTNLSVIVLVLDMTSTQKVLTSIVHLSLLHIIYVHLYKVFYLHGLVFLIENSKQVPEARVLIEGML